MKIQLVFGLILLISVIGGTVVQAKTAEDWINNATTFESQERYPQAIEAYGEALKLNTSDFSTWYKEAVALYKTERYEEALTAIEKTTELTPENAKAWYYQGLILGKLDRMDDALTATNKARMLGYIV